MVGADGQRRHVQSAWPEPSGALYGAAALPSTESRRLRWAARPGVGNHGSKNSRLATEDARGGADGSPSVLGASSTVAGWAGTRPWHSRRRLRYAGDDREVAARLPQRLIPLET